MKRAPALPADTAIETADNPTFRARETMATHRGIDLVRWVTSLSIVAIEADRGTASIQRTIGVKSVIEIDAGMMKQMEETGA